MRTSPLIIALAVLASCGGEGARDEGPVPAPMAVVSPVQGFPTVLCLGPGGSRIVVGDPGLPPNFSGTALFEARYVDGQGKVHVFPMDDSRIVDAAIFTRDSAKQVIFVDRHRTAWLWNPATGSRKELMQHTGPGLDIHEAKGRVAFMVGEMPQYDLYVFDLGTMRATRLTDRATPSWAPVFSPDGERIAFVQSPMSFPAVYTVDIATRAFTQLTQKGWTTERALREGQNLDPFPTSSKGTVWTADREIHFLRKGTTGTKHFVLHTATGVVRSTAVRGTLLRVHGEGLYRRLDGRITRVRPADLRGEVIP